MTLTYRLHKGSALTYGELDQNFRALDTRIQQLEEHTENMRHTSPRVRLDGLDWVFEDQDGREMARAGVPLPQFNPRGIWRRDDTYAPFDLVAHEGVLYLCIQNHMSDDFEQQRDSFQRLSNCTQAVPEDQRYPLRGIGEGDAPHIIPIHSLSSLPRPTIGALIIVVDTSGKQSLKVGMNKSWQTISTKALRTVAAQTSRELHDDETTSS